jgi:anti-sigma factor ChrR (cupin superfamily)
MYKRKITNPFEVDLKPFDRYGLEIEKMSWHKVSFDSESSFGTYVLKLEPGAQSIPHEHTGFEEFIVLEGELIDSDNTIFKKGDFVTFEPGSVHSSFTKKGCLILVFQRGVNKQI